MQSLSKLEKIRRLATVGLRQCKYEMCGDNKIILRTILTVCEEEDEKKG